MYHIVFISSNYPSKSRPHCGTFVHQLVRSIAGSGVKCSVISPVSIFDRKYGKFDPKISSDYVNENSVIKVIRPRYVSFSNIKLPFFNTDCLTQKSFISSVYRAMSYLDSSPSVMYGHFLYPSGAAAIHVANKLNIPSVAAVGESSFWSVEPLGYKKAIRDFSHVRGVVSVSSSIKKSLIDGLKIPENKIRVFPNGVDLSLFYPRNRMEMRNKFGLPSKKFIVSFIGHFDERKGPHRLLSAALDMEDIGLVFIGSGSVPLENKNILYKGILEHSSVPEMLSASDIFVLPTLEEGSCNAIIEAMACALPIVTSKGEFNDDIVDDDVAIRVDPSNIHEIRDAINLLRNNDKVRKTMSMNASNKVIQFDIKLRANRIVEWIDSISNNGKK